MFVRSKPGFDQLAFDSPLQSEWRENSDGTQYLAVRLYNALAASADTVVGRPYVLVFDGDEETNPKIAAPATSTVYQHVVVALEVVPNGKYGWFAIQGTVQALVDGTTDVAKDDFLEVLNTGTAFVKDGTARTVNAPAIACEARTADSAGLQRVYLFGDRVLIAAS